MRTFLHRAYPWAILTWGVWRFVTDAPGWAVGLLFIVLGAANLYLDRMTEQA